MSEDAINNEQEELSSADISEIAGAVAPIKPSQERISAMKSRIVEGVRAHEAASAAPDDVQRELALEKHGSAQAESLAALNTISVSSREWSSYSPGVEVCTLYDDGQRRTALLKMSPGSFLFPHKHQQIEESIVLEGNAIIGHDLEIQAGDYQFAEAGSEHPIISSPQGCIVLVHGESKPKIKFSVGLFTRLANHFLKRSND